MLHAQRTRARRLVRPALAACLSLLLLPAPGAFAWERLRETTSLGMVPSDAAFYQALLRNREQYEALVQSRAFQRVWSMPMVQVGMAQLRAGWEEPEDPRVAALKGMLEEPENRQLISVLLDAVSHEMFVYGGRGFVELAGFANGGQRGFRVDWQGDEEPDDFDAQVLRIALEHLDKLVVPELIVGFKITDPQPVQAQLDRLEVLAAMLLEMPREAPDLRGRFSRQAIGEVSFLVLELDGSLIPMDHLDSMISPETDRAAREDLERFKEHVAQMTLVVSIGIRGEYLLVSIGPTNEHLQRLGEEPSLIDRDELAPVLGRSGGQLVSLSYVSDSFQKAVARSGRWREQMAVRGKAALAQLSNVDEAAREELLADLEAFGQEVDDFTIEPGAVVRDVYLTDRGYEGYWTTWVDDLPMDGSRPLEILNHVGGSPLVLVAARISGSAEYYARSVHWLTRLDYHIEKGGLGEADDRRRYQRLRDGVLPILTRLDEVNRELLLPALADGQSALVIDSQLTSNEWGPLPPASDPLPVPEIGLVFGVSDAARLRQSCGEYFAAAQQLVKVVPEEFTGLLIPEGGLPQSRQFGPATIYFNTYPREWGLDRRIAPNGGLTEDYAAVSLVPLFTLRLLEPQSLQVGGPLADPQRPLAAAVHVDFAGLIDLGLPWGEYLAGIPWGEYLAGMVQQVFQQYFMDALPGFEGLDDAPGVGPPEAVRIGQWQSHPVVEVLKCFRGYTSATTFENGIKVTHFEWHFADLPD